MSLMDFFIRRKLKKQISRVKETKFPISHAVVEFPGFFDDLKNKTDDIFAADSLAECLAKSEKNFITDDVAGYLDKIIRKKKLKKKDIIVGCGIDRNYAYHIFDGRKKPSRDKLIMLAFGMELTVEETNGLLAVSRNMPLYPRDKRDTVIIYCMKHSYSLTSTNIELNELGLEMIE